MGGCKSNGSETSVYEFTMFRNGNISMWPDTISPEFLKALKSGHYALKDTSGELISEGNFQNGFRIGDWTYYPDSGKAITVNWDVYSKPTDNTKINVPSNWTIHEDINRPFQATFLESNGKASEGRYFIIQELNPDSVNMDLNAYAKYYKSTIFETEKVKEYAHFEFELRSGSKVYFLRYVIERGGDELLILVLLGNSGSKFCDSTYSSSNKDIERKHIIFFDMMRSFQLRGSAFFSPFDPVKRFRRTEFSSGTQTPAV
jgi:hypothetical protein